MVLPMYAYVYVTKKEKSKLKQMNPATGKYCSVASI